MVLPIDVRCSSIRVSRRTLYRANQSGGRVGQRFVDRPVSRWRFCSTYVGRSAYQRTLVRAYRSTMDKPIRRHCWSVVQCHNHLEQSSSAVKTCCFKMEKQFLCEECGVLFNFNQNRLRHVRNIHQGIKRSDNEKKKRDDVAKKMKLVHIYNSNIKAVIMEKFNPKEVICFPGQKT